MCGGALGVSSRLSSFALRNRDGVTCVAQSGRGTHRQRPADWGLCGPAVPAIFRAAAARPGWAGPGVFRRRSHDGDKQISGIEVTRDQRIAGEQGERMPQQHVDADPSRPIEQAKILGR